MKFVDLARLALLLPALPAQTVDKIKADLAKWGRVVREANIKVD